MTIVPHTEATTLTSLLFVLHADAVRRTRAFSEALANMQGEDIMLGIYDNIHDELRDTRRRLNNEKDKVSQLPSSRHLRVRVFQQNFVAPALRISRGTLHRLLQDFTVHVDIKS